MIIACLGLFALASVMVSQRTKEIGVRKTLGASVMNIILLLTKLFTNLVGIAFLIATPIAYLVGKQWLTDFAYRTNIGFEIFIGAGGISLIIAFLTVSYHSIKTALMNPVDALRYE